MAPRKITRFNPETYLSQAGLGTKRVKLKAGAKLFSQGTNGDSVFFIREGRVKLTVVSESGKEATLAFLSQGDFVGEDCVVNSRPKRLASAHAVTETSLMRIERDEMVRMLLAEPSLSELFIAYLLSRNARVQADLVDQLFNKSERRLARALLLLANFGKDPTPSSEVPNISQATLAEMIGTTRSRVNFFMNRFRKLGFIEYNGKLKVHNSLLTVVMGEE